MKKVTAFSIVLLLFFSFASVVHAGWDPLEREKEESAIKSTIENFLRADPDLKPFFDKAHAYAVFPTVGKGAFIAGIGYGKGWFYEDGKAVGKASITQISAGAQIGGQSYSEVIFFKDMDRINDFKNGRLELSAQLSAVIVEQGAATSANYANGVAIFILPKAGLMVEASVAGQKFGFEPFEK